MVGDEAVAFFEFWPRHRPRSGSALAVIQASLDVTDEPAEARRSARLLHAYELRFSDALADGV